MMNMVEYMIGFSFILFVFVSTFNFLQYISDMRKLNKVLPSIKVGKINKNKFKECLKIIEEEN